MAHVVEEEKRKMKFILNNIYRNILQCKKSIDNIEKLVSEYQDPVQQIPAVDEDVVVVVEKNSMKRAAPLDLSIKKEPPPKKKRPEKKYRLKSDIILPENQMAYYDLDGSIRGEFWETDTDDTDEEENENADIFTKI